MRKKGCKYLVCANAVWPNCCSQVSELFSRHSRVAFKSLRWERVFCFQNSSGLLLEKKNALVIGKNFCKLSDFSLNKFQNFFLITRTIYSNIEKSKIIYETHCFFKLVPRDFSDLIYKLCRTIIIQIGKSIWDLETNRKR